MCHIHVRGIWTILSAGRLISTRLKPGLKLAKQAQTQAQRLNFSFFVLCAYACVWAATSENEISLRHNTSTRIFTTVVWPLKTLDPDYHSPKQFGGCGRFCLCLCLRQISFSLGSSLLIAFVRLKTSSKYKLRHLIYKS